MAEYAKTPVLVLNKIAGAPFANAKFLVAPTLSAASFTILTFVAAEALSWLDFGVKNLPTPANATAKTPMIPTRITPLRSNDIAKPFRLFFMRSK